jgi:chromosome segregation ATPase
MLIIQLQKKLAQMERERDKLLIVTSEQHAKISQVERCWNDEQQLTIDRFLEIGKLEKQLAASEARVKELESESPTYKEICEVNRQTIDTLQARITALESIVERVRGKF